MTAHPENLRINNQLDASHIQHLFCHETLNVSGICCAHHQELSAVHLAIGMFHAGYVAASWDSQVGTEFQPDSPRHRPHNLHETEFQPDSPRQRPHNLHETYELPSVQLITPDDGHRRCPKHVEFRDKINLDM